MTLEIFLRYIHFISIFTIVATVVAEHLLLKPVLLRKDIARLARIDGVYGIAALALAGAGLTLWLTGAGKPTDFYSKNWIFHLKVTLFVCVGALSVYPTIYFLKNRKGNPDESVAIPKVITWLLRIELLILLIMPLLAGLMAKGIGYFG